jgi:hypothetical protein
MSTRTKPRIIHARATSREDEHGTGAREQDADAKDLEPPLIHVHIVHCVTSGD